MRGKDTLDNKIMELVSFHLSSLLHKSPCFPMLPHTYWVHSAQATFFISYSDGGLNFVLSERYFYRVMKSVRLSLVTLSVSVTFLKLLVMSVGGCPTFWLNQLAQQTWIVMPNVGYIYNDGYLNKANFC
jgi:hypothetical protein